jgi:hypothetical protein
VRGTGVVYIIARVAAGIVHVEEDRVSLVNKWEGREGGGWKIARIKGGCDYYAGHRINLAHILVRQVRDLSAQAVRQGPAYKSRSMRRADWL